MANEEKTDKYLKMFLPLCLLLLTLCGSGLHILPTWIWVQWKWCLVKAVNQKYACWQEWSKGQYRNLVFFWVRVWEDMVTATLFALFEHGQFLPINALLLRVVCWESRVRFDDVLLREATGQGNRVQSSGQRHSGQVIENIPCSRWNQRHS